MSVKDKLEQFFKNNNIKYTTYIDFGEPFQFVVDGDHFFDDQDMFVCYDRHKILDNFLGEDYEERKIKVKARIEQRISFITLPQSNINITSDYIDNDNLYRKTFEEIELTQQYVKKDGLIFFYFPEIDRDCNICYITLDKEE